MARAVVLAFLLVCVPAAAADPRPALVAERATLPPATDGERYAVWGIRGEGRVHVFDGVTRRERALPIARRCYWHSGQLTRVAAAGRLLLSCEAPSDGEPVTRSGMRGWQVLLDLSTGATRELPPETSVGSDGIRARRLLNPYFYLGRHWLIVNGSQECRGGNGWFTTVFHNWRTGERRVHCRRFDDPFHPNLDSPDLTPVCRAPARYSLVIAARLFEAPWLVKRSDRRLAAVTCDGRVTVLERWRPSSPGIHGHSPDLNNGIVTWTRTRGRRWWVDAMHLASGRRSTWSVPPTRRFPFFDEPLYAVHTAGDVFVAAPLQQSCDKICGTTAWRVYRAPLS